jgi:hypothetical protein
VSAHPLRCAISFLLSDFVVEFTVERREQVPAPINHRSAMSVLIEKARTRGRPEKKTETNKFDKMYNNVLQYLEEENVSWSSATISTTGKKFVTSLVNVLWHITCHHDRFSERGALLPSFVERFACYNYYIQKHQSKPQLEEKNLRKFISDIVTFLTQPWILKHKNFLADLNILVEGCKKIADKLERNNKSVSERHHIITSYSSENVSMSIRKGCTGMSHSY